MREAPKADLALKKKKKTRMDELWEWIKSLIYSDRPPRPPKNP